jgi:hypothetical protein
MFVHFFYREINNGILEATSFRGWFKLNCPLFLSTATVLQEGRN